jgi:hypothetical protein
MKLHAWQNSNALAADASPLEAISLLIDYELWHRLNESEAASAKRLFSCLDLLREYLTAIGVSKLRTARSFSSALARRVARDVQHRCRNLFAVQQLTKVPVIQAQATDDLA